jgi:hypothetical protein
MMVHSMHRAAAWRRVPCAAQLCAATDTLAWLLYRASAAVPKLIILILPTPEEVIA